jgi:hypothetical protein
MILTSIRSRLTPGSRVYTGPLPAISIDLPSGLAAFDPVHASHLTSTLIFFAAISDSAPQTTVVIAGCGLRPAPFLHLRSDTDAMALSGPCTRTVDETLLSTKS